MGQLGMGQLGMGQLGMGSLTGSGALAQLAGRLHNL